MENRGVGEKSSRINSPHPADQEGGQKTTLITGEASRGGSRLVKSGLISPSTRGANHPQLHQGEGHVESLGAGGHGGWTAGNQGPGRGACPGPGSHPLLWVLAVSGGRGGGGGGELAQRLTG